MNRRVFLGGAVAAAVVPRDVVSKAAAPVAIQAPAKPTGFDVRGLDGKWVHYSTGKALLAAYGGILAGLRIVAYETLVFPELTGAMYCHFSWHESLTSPPETLLKWPHMTTAYSLDCTSRS